MGIELWAIVLSLISIVAWSSADRKVRKLTRIVEDLQKTLTPGQPARATPPPPPPFSPPSRPTPAPPIPSPPISPPPAPLPPPLPVYTPAPKAPPTARAPRAVINWEQLVGVRFFSAIAGLSFIIAAIFFLRYSVESGWLTPPVRMALGLAAGLLLNVVGILPRLRKYSVTANALSAAGVATLYATLFASHSLWRLLSATPTFLCMVLVTAVAVVLAIRFQSLMIAILGLMGGFATPALLSTGVDRPFGLFGYLLIVNVGLAWVAYRKRWPWLLVLGVAWTTVYQWGWVVKFLTVAKLPLAAGIFLLFPIAGLLAFVWLGRAAVKERPFFQRVLVLNLLLPMAFALYWAGVREYGANYPVLFGYLFCLAAGLGLVGCLRQQPFLHFIGGGSVTLVALLWVATAYVPAAWNGMLAIVTGFALLYLLFPRLADRLHRPFGAPDDATIAVAPFLLFLVPLMVMRDPSVASWWAFAPAALLLLCAAWTSGARQPAIIFWLTAGALVCTELVWSKYHVRPDRVLPILALYGATSLVLLGLSGFRQTTALRYGTYCALWGPLALLTFIAGDTALSLPPWPLLGVSGVLLLACSVTIFSVPARGHCLQGLASPPPPAKPRQAAGLPQREANSKSLRSEIEPPPHASMARGIDSRGRLELPRTTGLPAGIYPAALFVTQLIVIRWAIATHIVPPWNTMAGYLLVGVCAFGVGWYAIAQSRARRHPTPHLTDLRVGTLLGVLVGLYGMAPIVVARFAPPFVHLLSVYALLLGLLLIALWLTQWHWVGLLALPGVFFLPWIWWTIQGTALWQQVGLLATVGYTAFLLYPLLLGRRVQSHRAPYVMATLANVPYFFLAWAVLKSGGLNDYVGLLPIGQAIAMGMLLLQLVLVKKETAATGQLGRLAAVAGATLALITIAIPLQLEKQWITIGFAIQAAALAWLYTRIPHRGLLYWALTLFGTVFLRLGGNRAVLSYHLRGTLPILNWYLYTYLTAVVAFLAGGRLLQRTQAQWSQWLFGGGLILFFLLCNIEIADYFSTGQHITFNFSAGLAQDLTYTLVWALFGFGLLIGGIWATSRGMRIAALVLLVATVAKGFGHDLWQLGGLYRVGSFVGLAICLALFALAVQRFVLRTNAGGP